MSVLPGGPNRWPPRLPPNPPPKPPPPKPLPPKARAAPLLAARPRRARPERADLCPAGADVHRQAAGRPTDGGALAGAGRSPGLSRGRGGCAATARLRVNRLVKTIPRHRNTAIFLGSLKRISSVLQRLSIQLLRQRFQPLAMSRSEPSKPLRRPVIRSIVAAARAISSSSGSFQAAASVIGGADRLGAATSIGDCSTFAITAVGCDSVAMRTRATTADAAKALPSAIVHQSRTLRRGLLCGSVVLADRRQVLLSRAISAASSNGWLADSRAEPNARKSSRAAAVSALSAAPHGQRSGSSPGAALGQLASILRS